MQDFPNAALMYAQLTKVCPTVEEYRLYHIQALVKAGAYEEANSVLLQNPTMENAELQERLHILQASIHYEQDEVQLAKNALAQECLQNPDDPEGKTVSFFDKKYFLKKN